MKDAEIQDGIQRSSAQVEVAQVRLDELQVRQVREAFAGPGDEPSVVIEADDMDPRIALRKPGSGETVCAACIQNYALSFSSKWAAHTATLCAMVVLIARNSSLPWASSATLLSKLLLQVPDERESSGACAHLVEDRRPATFLTFQTRVEQQICLLDATAK